MEAIEERGPFDYDPVVDLDAVYGVRFSETIRRFGGRCVSHHPPMWLIDGCTAAHDFVRSVTGEATRFVPMAIRPTMHVRQLLSETPTIHEPLHRVLRELFRRHVPPLYTKSFEENEHSDSDRHMRPTEVLHVDRVRANPHVGEPMSLTMVLSHSDDGGTLFPHGVPFANVESLVRPCRDGVGFLVPSRVGRILLFASASPRDRRVPLHASLHQGVVVRSGRRRVTGLGIHGREHTDVSCWHEMLDHESFEMRSSFFGRTLEQELVGALGGDRRIEAASRLDAIVDRRREGLRTLIDEILREASDRAMSEVPPNEHGSSGDEPMPAKIFASTSCSVCFGEFASNDAEDAESVPVALSCGHVVCEDCVSHLVTSVTPRAVARCPMCRVPFVGYTRLLELNTRRWRTEALKAVG